MVVESDFVDFAHYYAYGTIAAYGLDLFDPGSLTAIDGLQTLRRAAGDPIYPPLFYLAMRPFSRLSFTTASLAWLFLNQALLLASLTIAVLAHGRVSRLSMASMGRISPVSMAAGRNTAGDRIPRRGWFQRISASAPVMRRDRTSTLA